MHYVLLFYFLDLLVHELLHVGVCVLHMDTFMTDFQSMSNSFRLEVLNYPLMLPIKPVFID